MSCKGNGEVILVLLLHNNHIPIVLVNTAFWGHLDTQTLKNHLSGHPNVFVRNFNLVFKIRLGLI